MITIIKPGVKPIFRHTCEKCGCIFEFEESDIITLFVPMDGCRLINKIKCPCCEKGTMIDKEECLVNKHEFAVIKEVDYATNSQPDESRDN